MGKKKRTSILLVFCLVFSVLMPQNAVYAESIVKNGDENGATVIDAADYGADPSGGSDSAQAIQKAIEAAKELEGPVIINFPKGEYQIYPDKAYERELYVSNTVGSNQSYKMKKIGFLFEDMENVTVEGNGSLFMFHGKMTTFAAIRSSNITFQNYAFDFYVPTVIDLTVESVTDSTATVYVPECYNYDIKGSSIVWSSDVSPYTGNTYWTAQNSMNYTQICNIRTGKTFRSGNHLFSNVSSIEDSGNRRLKFTYSNRDAGLEAGNCYQMRYTDRDHPGMFFWRSTDIVLKDLDAHFLHGFGIVGQHSENITLHNVDFAAPDGSGRTTAGYADFIQMSGCKGQILIEDCSFSNPHDDPINVHGTYNQVVERLSARKFMVRYMHNETSGFPNFFVGDSVEFMTKGNMIPVPDSVAKVVEVSGPTGESGESESGTGRLDQILITLDKDIELDRNTDYVVENITYTPNVIIRNNIFKETPTRGVLVTTRGKVEILDNTFDGLGMASIYISNDAQGWYESGPVRDVTIQGNVFMRQTIAGNAPAVIFIEPTNPTVSTSATVHENITITENDFYLLNGKVLDAKSVKGLNFTKNNLYRYEPGITVNLSLLKNYMQIGEIMTLSGSALGSSQNSNLYAFNGCKDVVISGNVYDGGLKLGGSFQNMSESDIVQQNGESISFTSSGTALPAVGSISYESSDEEILQVTANGDVTARKEGTAKVRAYTVTGGRKFVSDWKEIIVRSAVESSMDITSSPDLEAVTEYGQEILYSASITPQSPDAEITWSVKDAATGEDTDCASIDADGRLTAVSDGAVEVIASAPGGIEARKLLVIHKGGFLKSAELQIVNEVKDGWSTTPDGKILISARKGGLWAGNARVDNIILKSFSEDLTNVTATVKMSGKTRYNYDEAGLIFYKDGNNYAAVQRKHGAGNPDNRLVNEVGTNASEGDATSDISENDIWYKLEKTGSSLTGYYSADGAEWIKIREVENTALGNDFSIGVLADCGNEHDPATQFVFSDLKVTIGDGEEQTIPLTVRNQAPTASNVTCSYAQGKLEASYEFADTDSNEKENGTLIKWLVSDREDGTYKLVPGLMGSGIKAFAELADKYVKAVVIPQDEYGLYGIPQMAQTPVLVGADAAIMPETVTIGEAPESVQEYNKEIQYTAMILPAEASQAIDWSIVNAGTEEAASCASIDETGKLTPLSDGAVEVVARTVGGKEARKLLVINRGGYVKSPEIEIVQENAEKWNVTSDGKILIHAQNGGLWSTGASARNRVENLVLSSLSEDLTNVTAVVKMNGKTKSNYDEAGLIFYKDTDNYVTVQRKHGTGAPANHVVNEVAGNPNEENSVADISGDEIWYKLEKTGNSLTGYYSIDGNFWNEIGTVENTGIGNDFKIGVIATSGSNNATGTPFIFSDLKVIAGDGAETRIPMTFMNQAPTASNVSCTNTDGKVEASYDFSDPDKGDAEGDSIVRWMVADEENGSYALVKNLDSLENKWVKSVVIPQDSYGLYGSPAVAEKPIQVAAIAKETFPAAESALKSASFTGISGFAAFNSNTKFYLTTAAKEQDTAAAVFEAKDPMASVKVSVNGTEVSQNEAGNYSINLISGLNVILVKVIAEDEKTQADYRFAVIRTGDTSADLSGISLNDTPISGFEADTLEYDYSVAAGTESVNVKAMGVPSKASVIIGCNGKATEGSEAVVKLVPGLNDIYIRIKPETLVPEKYYHVIVSVPKGDNANLRRLKFSSGVFLEDLFNTETLSYTGMVTVPEVSLNLEAEEANAKVELTLDGESIGEGTGSLHKELSMGIGINRIGVKVTSPDGTAEKAYMLEITGITDSYLSEMQYDAASSNGYGDFQMNMGNEGTGKVALIMEDGSTRQFESGIGAHAPMELIYDIEGMGFVEFSSWIGIDQDVTKRDEPSVKVFIYLDDDDTPVWTSGDEAMGADTPAKFAEINVEGKSRIRIVADEGANNWSDHISLGDAKFSTALKPTETKIYEIRYQADPRIAGTIEAKSGNVTTNNGRIPVNEGGSATLTAAAASGYKFLGWYDGTGKEVSKNLLLTLSDIRANASYTAKFEESDKDPVNPPNPPITPITPEPPVTPITPEPPVTPITPEPSKDGLSSAIREAEKLDVSIYTPESVKEYQAALENAKKVLANNASTQEDIDNALLALTKAKDALKKKDVSSIGDSIKETEIIKGNSIYRVVNVNTVSFIGLKQKKKTAVVDSVVTGKSGKSYQVTSIGKNVLKKNRTLKKVVIGKNIKTIGKQAFYQCSKLSSITFQGTKAPKIEKKAFKGIKKNCKIYVSKKMPQKQVNKLKKQLKKAGIKNPKIVKKKKV